MVWKYIVGTLGGALLGGWAAGEERRMEGAVAGGVGGLVVGHLAHLIQKAPPVGEGDYSSWSKIWDVGFPDPGLYWDQGVSITLSGKYAYILWADDDRYWRLLVLDITDGSTVYSQEHEDYVIEPPDLLESTWGFIYNALSWWGTPSILGKYLLILRADDTMTVWKDGVEQWTSPLASEVVSGASKYYAVLIEPSGRYVVATTDNDRIVCFEGR